MPQFSVEHLHGENLAEAAALIRVGGAESVPGLWEIDARTMLGRGGGVLVARGADNSVHGVATYEVIKRPRTGRVLAVATLFSIDLSRKQPAKRALVETLEQISAAFGCSALAFPASGHASSEFTLQAARS